MQEALQELEEAVAGHSYSPASEWVSAPAEAAADTEKLRYTERSVAGEAAHHCHCHSHWPQEPRTESQVQSWSCGDQGPRVTGSLEAAVTCWARSDAAGGRASLHTSCPRDASCRTDH